MKNISATRIWYIDLLIALFLTINIRANGQNTDFYDVTKAGVKNDGSEDVRNKLGEIVKMHTKLYFPAGQYSFNGQLELNVNNAFFKGDGSSTVFIQNKKYSNLLISSGNNCTFKKIKFLQTGYGDESNMFESYGSGITIYRTNNNIIDSCSFENCGELAKVFDKSVNNSRKSSAGVYVSGGENNLIINCSFEKCLMGVNVDDFLNFRLTDSRRFKVNSNRVINNYFEDCFRGIVYDYGGVDGGKGLGGDTLRGNTFVKKTVGDKAILLALFNNIDSIVVVNNKITGAFGDGIGLTNGSAFVRISSNKINGAYSGITVYSKGFFNKHINVFGNSISNSAFSAISLVSSGDVNISNNNLSGNKTGITLSNYPDGITIQNNLIDSIVSNGISIENVSKADISFNKFAFRRNNQNKQQGINIKGAIAKTISIENNYFSSSVSSNLIMSSEKVLPGRGSDAVADKVVGIVMQTNDKARILNLKKLNDYNKFEGIKIKSQ